MFNITSCVSVTTPRLSMSLSKENGQSPVDLGRCETSPVSPDPMLEETIRLNNADSCCCIVAQDDIIRKPVLKKDN